MSARNLLEGVLPGGVRAAGEVPVRIVVIGAGPASVMLLERVVASHRRDHPGLPLDIRVIDPHEPGGGRIWRKNQSPLLKLNSMLEDVAFFTDASCELEGPIEPGPSLAQWVQLVRAGEIPAPASSDAILERELAHISDRDFPTRRLNNGYLGWAYREVLRRAASDVSVSWHLGLAVAVEAVDQPASGGERGAAVHVVRLESGDELVADIVVHAVGHNGSVPSSASVELGSFADRHGLGYVAPAFTADLDLDWIPAGENVIVRGMGLAAIDLTVMLTEGRGGIFSRDSDGRLSYLPSGREPRLFLGSRRGVPYRSKVTSSLAGEPVQLKYLNEDFHAALVDRAQPLDFERDVWPLLCAELLTGYYRELFTAHVDRVSAEWATFSARLQAVLDVPGGYCSPELSLLIRQFVPDPDDRFELPSFDRPLDFAGEGAAGHEPDCRVSPSAPSEDDVVHQRVLEHIAQDLRQRTVQEHSASQALFLTGLFAFMSVAEIAPERWNALSRARSLPGRWQSFFSYLASGPPGHRLEELSAVAEAGVIRFLGGDIEVTLDDTRGRFVASGSGQAAGGSARSSVVANTLIDAWLPQAQAERSDNPLLRHLVASGVVTELTVADAHFSGSTGQVVVGEGGRLPGATRQFALGPFTSSPGAGAFTRPGINSLSFRVHDRVARAVLAAATSVAVEREISEGLGARLR